MIKLSHQQARNNYNNGNTLCCSIGGKPTVIFTLLGRHYTSTKKRARNGKHYKLDNGKWSLTIDQTLYKKIRLILTGGVYYVRKGR